MRYDPATSVCSSPGANTGVGALHRHVSTMRPLDRNEVARRQAVELDVWEDEGGTSADQAPEFPRRHAEWHFDEFSG
jgi:hypothetical protein